jgi:hypothetical protein
MAMKEESRLEAFRAHRDPNLGLHISWSHRLHTVRYLHKSGTGRKDSTWSRTSKGSSLHNAALKPIHPAHLKWAETLTPNFVRLHISVQGRKLVQIKLRLGLR